MNSIVTIPDDAYCPISQMVMTDPVICADGFSYDRVFIEQWLSTGHRTSPKTGLLLEHTTVIPNITLRTLIQELHERMPAGQREQLKQLSERQNLEAIVNDLAEDQAAATRLKSTNGQIVDLPSVPSPLQVDSSQALRQPAHPDLIAAPIEAHVLTLNRESALIRIRSRRCLKTGVRIHTAATAGAMAVLWTIWFLTDSEDDDVPWPLIPSLALGAALLVHVLNIIPAYCGAPCSCKSACFHVVGTVLIIDTFLYGLWACTTPDDAFWPIWVYFAQVVIGTVVLCVKCCCCRRHKITEREIQRELRAQIHRP